ncbi:hypothetical protein Tco_1081065 [Tanacetum coccineum]|uniref:Uncharacterized protein n=1 Tax=Tanacetum coccineum TaxID=301880 RepID=A0ABQ5HY09_9ASTR
MELTNDVEFRYHQITRSTDDKDCSLMFGVFKLMKCVSEDSGDELEYLRELFLDTDLHNVLSLHRHYKLRILIGAPFTQGTISSIPIGGSISPEGFLPSILLLVNHALLSDPLTSRLCWWLPPKFEASRVPVGSVFLLGLLALAIVAACASRAVAMPLAISCWMAAKVMASVSDVDVLQHKETHDKNDITSFKRGYGMIHNDGDGDNDAYDDDGDDDVREISWYL